MPVVTRPAEPTHTLPGARFTSLATPSRGGSEVSVWHVALDGHDAPEHALTRGEVFVALRGRAVVTLDGVPGTLAAGDTLVVPPGVRFRLRAEAGTGFEALCCMPAGGQAVLADGEPVSPPWAQ
jgi:mannose-6-phosphate isomerase-like protein (cupin superfamily)